MSTEEIEAMFSITGRDYTNAGRASTSIKGILKRLGINPAVVRRTAIASYEAEMNLVMYAVRGTMHLRVNPATVTLEVEDEGPGIKDIALAMQEGYSTATPEMREMGFGAGMGLPNIKRNSDQFEISSAAGRGTRLSIRINQAS
jgi:anti-sigma regulatory factor (Ser/Thr protein kinase)